ncbi:MAG: HAD-IA family hydrolase, partial [Pseudomonadota bacterium]
RSGGRGYVALDILHRENLERVLERHRLREYFDEEEVRRFARCWERLDPWPDVVSGLMAAREAGLLVAPCSNGSVALMAHLARYAGFHWDAIVGAGLARDYKPKPAVYAASCEAMGCAPGEVMMVAAHNDDLAAARAAGLMTGFFARPLEHGPGQRTDLAAESDWDVVAEDLPGLVAALRQL